MLVRLNEDKNDNEIKYKVGDKVWYVPWPRYKFAVLCNIKEIHTDMINCYCLDEPIGHSVDSEEITQDISEVFEEFKEGNYSDELITLEYFRKRQQDGIRNSWERAGEIHPGFEPLPDKEEGKEWLNKKHLGTK